MVRVNDPRGDENWFESAGVRVIKGSSYRGQNCSKCMTEIQGKSILVRVSARFELARVRVIGSRLYYRLKFRLVLSLIDSFLA